jgi:hypothetical protein
MRQPSSHGHGESDAAIGTAVDGGGGELEFAFDGRFDRVGR